MIQAARQKLASLTARLAALKPEPQRSETADISLQDLVDPELTYPIIITYPNTQLQSSFLDLHGVAHLTQTDYDLYVWHHKKDL